MAYSWRSRRGLGAGWTALQPLSAMSLPGSSHQEQQRSQPSWRSAFVLVILLQFAPTSAHSQENLYFLKEGFEGPGFENSGWLKHGNPNEDYTNTVLHGAES